MHPASAFVVALAPYAKLGKGGVEETNGGLQVADDHVCVFESNFHGVLQRVSDKMK
jgi:hypothetical protein